MDGEKNVCAQYSDGETRDYKEEWPDFMAGKLKITW